MFGRIKRYSLLAIILLLFWIILTSNFTFFNILLGAVCSGIAALIGDYLFKGEYEPVKNALAVIARFLWYLPLLIIEIVKANVDVAKRVLNPQLPISPVVIEFESRLKGDLAKVVLANSITLTPGTLTVDIRGDTFFVHCLAEEYAKDLLDRKLENMVFWVFFGSGGREAGAGGTTQGSFPA